MLDTNVCIDLLRGRTIKVLARMRRYEVDQLLISSVTLAELHYGASRSARPMHHELLIAQFCAPLAILPFDERAAELYGTVRSDLERIGTPIGPLDSMIASHALSLAATLVTNNEREFCRVSGLRIENWQKS